MNCEGAEDLGTRFVSHIKNEESVDSLMRRIDRVLDGTFSTGRLSNLPKSSHARSRSYKSLHALLNHFRR